MASLRLGALASAALVLSACGGGGSAAVVATPNAEATVNARVAATLTAQPVVATAVPASPKPAAAPPSPSAPPAPPATPTAAPNAPGRRANPFPAGTTVRYVRTTSAGVRSVYEITITEVQRGAEGERTIRAMNQFNGVAPAGMETLLIKVKLKYVEGPADKVESIGYRDFRVTGSDNTLRGPVSLSGSGSLGADLFPGGEVEGWAWFAVQAGEARPLLGPAFGFEAPTIWLAVL